MNAKYTLTPSIGYGTENNWGNTGFFGGLSVSNTIKKRWLIEADLTYFTTAIYNVYKTNPTFYLNGDRKYHSLFLNLNLQYVVGKESSLINAKIKAGPALKYYDTKILLISKVYYNPKDKLHPIVPGSEKYYEKQGLKTYTVA